MISRILGSVVGAIAVIVLVAQAPEANAQTKIHRVAIHVDQSDPKVMNMALNNAANVTRYYTGKGEEVEIEIVAYGPGLNMLRSDKSPVKARILSFGENFDNITFAACGNTMAKMAKKEKKAIPLLANVKQVTSGVVRLIELQEMGWAYVRP